MFGAIAAAAAVNGAVNAMVEHKEWKRCYDLATPNEQRRMIEARNRAHAAAVEERRHRELVDATKRSSSGFGMGFIWGLIIGR